MPVACSWELPEAYSLEQLAVCFWEQFVEYFWELLVAYS